MVNLVTAGRIERILVTDAHELAGIGALRSLGRAGHRVTGLYSPTALVAEGLPPWPPPAAWSRHATAVRPAPDPWTAQPAFAQALLAELQRGQYDALLPVSEASILAAQSLRDKLPAGLLLLMPTDAALHYTLSKYHLNQAALRLGVRIPRTAFVHDGLPRSPFDASAVAALRYPVVVKTDNHLTPAGEYRRGRTLVVPQPAQLAGALLAAREDGGAVIVQEHVPGRGAGAFLLRAGGQTVLRFAHKRLHEVPYTGGVSSLRASSHDAGLLALAEQLLAGLGYEGVAMVEFRVDADGRPFLLEINGRLWGSLALSLHSGVDFPLALLTAARGAPPAAPASYPDGLRCRNVFPGELHYLRSVLGAPASDLSRRDKAAAVAEFFLLSLDPRVRHDYLWWSDPLPSVVQAAGTVRHLLHKQLERPARLVRARRAAAGWRALIDRQHGLRAQPPPATRTQRPVLFLCHGNICRSPFAAAYFNEQVQRRGLGWPPAQSAGFYPKVGRPTPPLLRGLAPQWGVDLESHRSQLVTREQLFSASAVFVMDADNLAELQALASGSELPIYALGRFDPAVADDPSPAASQIADPYETSPAKSYAVYQQIVAAIDGLLAAWAPAP
jgi:protein-tyrosine-phosphatase/predicted ATP-grasp superfamily ATP-dependent carboligase